MKFASLARAAVLLAVLPALGAGQTPPPAQVPPPQPAPPRPGVPVTKIAIIDIDRVAAQSNPGKALFQRLKEENDKLAAEKARREQEIRDMQAKMASEILSADARERLSREIERKTTDLQRWLEDAQREFQDRQKEGEEEFQKKLGPIVEAVAKEQGIGLILRATAGLTFVVDPTLDITPLVVAKLNEAEQAKPPAAPRD